MGEWAINALVVGFFAWLIWSVFQPRYFFEIRIKSGQARVRKGKVTQAFLIQVNEVCQESGVARGWIRGVLRDKNITLRFSRHFPPGSRQKLRNEWHSGR